MPAVPAIFDDQAPTMRRRAPTIGEHTREILAELGYDDATIAALHDTGVVGREAQ
jgi:formyl-CoA transferase